MIWKAIFYILAAIGTLSVSYFVCCFLSNLIEKISGYIKKIDKESYDKGFDDGSKYQLEKDINKSTIWWERKWIEYHPDEFKIFLKTEISKDFENAMLINK